MIPIDPALRRVLEANASEHWTFPNPPMLRDQSRNSFLHEISDRYQSALLRAVDRGRPARMFLKRQFSRFRLFGFKMLRLAGVLTN